MATRPRCGGYGNLRRRLRHVGCLSEAPARGCCPLPVYAARRGHVPERFEQCPTLADTTGYLVIDRDVGALLEFRAGIEFGPGQVCGMHSLRGALAVAMIGGGAPMPVVSAVLGHTSSDTTQAYYLRFDVERLRGCALDVEDVLERDRAGERGA